MIDSIYDEFYNSPVIAGIANNARWTASTNQKIPIDAVILRDEQRIAGAKYMGPRSLMALDELHNLPGMTNPNTTYYLEAENDRICVLDIEPKCPEDIRNELLKMPYVYGEVSASGNGLHLVFPLPEKYDDYPVLKRKTCMKEKNGYYEILLNHYVIFTRRGIGPAKGGGDFNKLFYEMAKEQKISLRKNVDVLDIKPDDIQDEDLMLQRLANITYAKEPSDFDGDISRYEFGYTGHLHNTLKRHMAASGIEYTDTEKAWLVYEITKDYIEYRGKHDTCRDGLPWLLYLAKEVIAQDDK
jgi:hypothetical protein